MTRTIAPRIDALYVEGPDDGAVVNAFIYKLLGIDLGPPVKLVRAHEPGGGHRWASREFMKYIEEAPAEARIGLVIDRDGKESRPDNWPAVRDALRRRTTIDDDPPSTGLIVDKRLGVWMWPDNVSAGDLEDFVAGIVPRSPLLDYAVEASGIAKNVHGAEYQSIHARKAALKVRSIWRDAGAAGGYGHLLRNLPLGETPASKAFLAWFTELFLKAGST